MHKGFGRDSPQLFQDLSESCSHIDEVNFAACVETKSRSSLVSLTDSHNLRVQLNVELFAGPLRWRVVPVSVTATVPASISVAASAKLTASKSACSAY